MSAPRVGTCYCGCGEETRGHFARGHDARARSMLLFLADRGNIAVLLRMAGFGPDGNNLTRAAEAAGWTDRWRKSPREGTGGL
jgi:hypothetical protein